MGWPTKNKRSFIEAELKHNEDELLIRKKLQKVKVLYDDGLITEEVLKKKQEQIMGLKD